MREQVNAGIYRGDPSVGNSVAIGLGEYYKAIYLAHIGGYYQLFKNLRINVVIYNLFDCKFIQYTAYGANNASYGNAFNYVR
ncbi:hypothetical protein DCO58_09375 [Helicobacter saguini]|uniref:TonB-dependent receptor-like beta-barrel domain-containing protein n=1 Tax=Helicobacter saguini TaxID=1548018 RepID=A0A347VP84_9HELI|nr:hypothetical protein [Helicobacter saguini]MWV61471.1 hypothetical protein [Helicobacter saguini]MWV67857.1 hypothetical protein [Helicobacter saguini]MWV70674.1 hypothetical protein [Helicobacter saguini]MWV72578.1 hypothetical protein [Helicobacter saguini]TLD94606.1 hypothetical protein LS64_005475 [Helicobacter saguini]